MSPIREWSKTRRAAAASCVMDTHYVNYLSNNTRSRACRAARAWYLGLLLGCVVSFDKAGLVRVCDKWQVIGLKRVGGEWSSSSWGAVISNHLRALLGELSSRIICGSFWCLGTILRYHGNDHGMYHSTRTGLQDNGIIVLVLACCYHRTCTGLLSWQDHGTVLA